MRKETISFVISVCLSVRPSVRPHGKTQLPRDGFSWHLIDFFFKSVQKIKDLLKFDKNKEYFTWSAFMTMPRSFFSEWKTFQAKFLWKTKSQILCSITFRSFQNRAVYEIVWKNIVEQDRPQMTISRMRIACFVPPAIATNSECAIPISTAKNGYVNAPQFYVYSTLPILLLVTSCVALTTGLALYSRCISRSLFLNFFRWQPFNFSVPIRCGPRSEQLSHMSLNVHSMNFRALAYS